MHTCSYIYIYIYIRLQLPHIYFGGNDVHSVPDAAFVLEMRIKRMRFSSFYLDIYFMTQI